ncbi:MAG: hypothetical protein ABIC57_02380 [bacterium]
MKKSKNIEELEINFAAFVISSRTVTFVLQNQFSKNIEFNKWYGTDNNKKSTKRYEMKNDPLCQFFIGLRNSIEKKGIYGIKGVRTQISSFQSEKDILEKPKGMDATLLRADGIFISIYPNTPKADIISAKTKASFSTLVILENIPDKHLNKKIQKKGIIETSMIYYRYLENLVEEWTGIVNKD